MQLNAWQWLGAVALGVLGASACRDSIDPRGFGLSARCEACVEGEGDAGCGAQERHCTEDPDCEVAMLCGFRSDCFAEPAESECLERFECQVAGDAGALFGEIEQCVRTVCQKQCGFVE